MVVDLGHCSGTPKARSGLVEVFQRTEKKLGGSLGSYSSRASVLEAYSLSANPFDVV